MDSYEIEKLNELKKVFDNNGKIMKLYSILLTQKEDIISFEEVESLVNKFHISFEMAYSLIIESLFGLNEEDSFSNEIFNKEYVLSSLKCLENGSYDTNPYLKIISQVKLKGEAWEIKQNRYIKGKAFVYDDIKTYDNFKEVPSIGFFKKDYSYTQILEENNEWMSVTPNEIETMKDVIAKVHGNVITFGLGLGYFPYMISLKDDVKKIYIVEKDERVIKLFKNNVLPLFEHKEKIEIINEEGISFIENDMKNYIIDYCFYDMWRDVSDGVPFYYQLKKYEDKFKNIQFDYWIEKSILSNIRYNVFYDLYDFIVNKELPIYVPLIIVDKINTYEEFIYYLSDEFLDKLVKTKIL